MAERLISKSSGCIVAQFNEMKGPLIDLTAPWISRAITSFPDPAGPVIRTRLFVGATLATDCLS